ncbi:MAG: hypothetical protein ABJ139_19990, partial [Paracoccaceae bacterium]
MIHRNFISSGNWLLQESGLIKVFNPVNILLGWLKPEYVRRQRLWVQIALFDKRVFLAHRHHRGVAGETDNWHTQKPWREARQR